MIVDAHQHVWDLSRADYPWLDESLGTINRTMELDEIWPAMRAEGVDATILVQAADNLGDTVNMFRVADAHPQVVGVVVWLPLDEPERASDLLLDFGADTRVVGVRTLLHARADPDWVLRSDVDAGLGAVEEARMAFDYVTGAPSALVHIPELSSRHPELSIVIDHLGKPPVGGSDGERREWRRLIAEAAENPLVSAKLSGLYSSTGDLAEWSIDSVRPFVSDALEIFGPHRLLYGGDWPISLLAGGYQRTWRALSGLVDELAPECRDAILGDNAASIYHLDHELLATAAGATRGKP